MSKEHYEFVIKVCDCVINHTLDHKKFTERILNNYRKHLPMRDKNNPSDKITLEPLIRCYERKYKWSSNSLVFFQNRPQKDSMETFFSLEDINGTSPNPSWRENLIASAIKSKEYAQSYIKRIIHEESLYPQYDNLVAHIQELKTKAKSMLPMFGYDAVTYDTRNKYKILFED